MLRRPRRNRKNSAIRDLVAETTLSVSDLVQPLFIVEGSNQKQEIEAMPGCHRYSVDQATEFLKECFDLGIKAVAPFPKIEESKKDTHGREAINHNGLVPEFIKTIKREIPELLVITDVALDPYSVDGHDGIVRDGKIENDLSVEVLSKMALVHAQAGADFVAPSDMMDGRVKGIRETLDSNYLTETGIISYSAKYASSFYGPFRDALSSAPKAGDKKSYQMNPANIREALIEAELDTEEGADVLMVKPAMTFLDVISKIRNTTNIPIAAYNVSGEYSMVKAAAARGWVDERQIRDEILLSIKRAGADFIFTYFAYEYATESHS